MQSFSSEKTFGEKKMMGRGRRRKRGEGEGGEREERNALLVHDGIQYSIVDCKW